MMFKRLILCTQTRSEYCNDDFEIIIWYLYCRMNGIISVCSSTLASLVCFKCWLSLVCLVVVVVVLDGE